MSALVLVDVQHAGDLAAESIINLPSEEDITNWLCAVQAVVSLQANVKDNESDDTPSQASNSNDTQNNDSSPEISIRIVTKQESQALNAQYRGKDKPTNVLSFESDLPDFVPSRFLGDLVICAQIVVEEAKQQNKAVSSHWAHMCIHGMLHLLGFDHINDIEATQMEAIEINALAKLGIADPYQIS